MKNKKVIVVGIVVLIFCVVFFKAIHVVHNKKDDNLTYNKNQSFIKDKDVKGIVFKDIECVYDGKDSTIKYKIVNKTKKKIHLKNYDILVKDKKKVLITKIVVGFDQVLDVGKEVKMANYVVGTDLSDSYYMELKLNSKSKK